MINGNMIGGSAPLKTVKLVDENGGEILGVVVDQETIFTATDNDVREGFVYAGDSGVSIGTKEIPAYHTSEGKKIILAGKAFTIPLENYDYTALQVLICAYNTSASDSVAVDRVGIQDTMYEVESTVALSTITKDASTTSINLGITNDTNNKFVIRYFTYKEIY